MLLGCFWVLFWYNLVLNLLFETSLDTFFTFAHSLVVNQLAPPADQQPNPTRFHFIDDQWPLYPDDFVLTYYFYTAVILSQAFGIFHRLHPQMP